MQGSLSVSLSLYALNSFFLAACLSGIIGGGDGRRRGGGRLEAAVRWFVCLRSENRIHLCDPDAYAQLSASPFVCVAPLKGEDWLLG